MNKCLKSILFWIFKLLSLLKCLRLTLIQYIAFNPPEVGYLIRNRNEIIRVLTSTVIQEERSSTFNEKPLIPYKKSRRMSYLVTNEHLCSPKIKYYNTIQSTNYKQQIRNPMNLDQYPQQEFNFISTELKAMEIDNNPGFPISSYVLESRSGNFIATIYIEYPKSDQIILYSHGNSTDIGLMFDTYIDIVKECQINLFSYDYSGYGQSTGYPTDINLIHDIESAYQFLVDQMQFEPRNIIVYGYSIGSGPSTNLASRHNVGGLIIHSGLSSGLRVMDSSIKKTDYNDFFPNVEYIVDVVAPVYVLHGGADSMINVAHAEQLALNANHLFSVWLVEKGGHGDIESQWRELYYIRLRRFLQYCSTVYVNKPLERKRQISHIYDLYNFEGQDFYISLLEF